MHVDGRTPHLIVGIDFGQTCTGVSYINRSLGTDTVRWIQKWPGRTQANENKVPTVLVYQVDRPEPSSWGFLSEAVAEQQSRDKQYIEWFKTCLDNEKWYEDYLRKLYEHIKFKLTPDLSATTWDDATIEFIFSVPTTWEPYPTVEAFRAVAQRAGFAQHPTHTVAMGLTEAEAAAVHTSTEARGIFHERDILLVADIGGGTTDLTVLRVRGTESETLTLEQLDVVFGDSVGSAAIDYEFELLARRRLEEADRAAPLGIPLENLEWEMMKSREFQNVKCDHGSPSDTPLFSVAVPGLSRSYENKAARIVGGEMSFTREELQGLFDTQLDKLYKLIDIQLNRLLESLPHAQVNHMILSGGLGSSPYVQHKLSLRYGSGLGQPWNTQQTHVRTAPDPQLAVCKGLVLDRSRRLKEGKSVLGTRCCRKSFGTLCKVLYDPNNPEHMGKSPAKDPHDGKKYLSSAVAWFIKKGEPVSLDEPLSHTFVKKIGPDAHRAFSFSVISSDADPLFLPQFLDSNTTSLCDVKSDLSGADETKFKERNRHFWNLRKMYLEVEYEVKVIVGPADLRFELWFDGQKLSRDQPIRVDWAPSTHS